MGGGAGRPSAPYSYAYRSARPTSAIVPYATGGAIVPSPSSAGGAGIPPSSGGGGSSGGMGGLGNFARAMGGINLPGAGVINELGQEFGFATKQVLLFGQAYKLLGFLQSFPGEVGAAVGALQSYRNTLDAVTPSAEEARASNELLLGLMDKYNIPLQSARDGFTKLYASMAPAGFSGDEIRSLFTGISKAAATFGMSADKVDRVNYAFAQMASKGQVMSEELKGQLGDVLPGSMALFAKAAGFEGPKAIQDFSVALEAGAYKGEAMVALLKNVTTVMNKEFGPGAEGAALTFQGVMSRMQNSVTLLYESFEPVAVGFLNTVVVPLTSGIKQVTDGISAFMSGTAAKTSGGFALAQELEKLRPAFSGIGQNVAALVTQLAQFANVALQVGKVFLQIAGNPFVGYLARVYINILALTTAIQLLNLRALIPMIASFGRSVFALITFTAQCVRAGQAVQVTGLMMRTFFATTGVGLLVLGIGLLTEKFMSMNQALADTRAKALGAADAIRSMSSVEARAAEQGAKSAYRTIGTIAGRAGEKVQGRGNERLIEISAQELKQLESIGSLQTAKDPITGRITARRSDILSLAPQAQRLQAQASGRISDLRFEEKQAQQQAVLTPIPPGEGDTKGLKKAQSDAETLAKQEQQRAIELQNQRNKLAEIGFQKELAMSNDAFEHHKSLIDAKNEYELSGLNDIQARQKKFAQDLEKIQLERIATVRKAQDEMAKANFEATTAAATAQAAGGTDVPTAGAMVDKSVLRNWLISQGFGRTTGDFTNAGHQTPNHMLNAMDMGILGGSDADALRKTADMEKKLRATGAFGNQLFGPISDPYGHGAGKGGSNIHLHIPTPGGKFKMTSGLAGLMGGKQSSAAFSMETKAQKETFDLQQAQASKSAAQEKAALQIRNAAQLAIEKTATLIKTNIDSIYPIEQQKLENQLMKIRNDLQLQGMPSELISFEESKAKAQMEGAAALDVMNKNLAKSEAELTNYEDLIKKGAKADSTMTMEMVRLRGEITNYKAAIADMPAKQKELNIAMLEGAIAAMKNADALKAIEETSGRINDAVEGVTGAYKGLFKEIAMGADSVDALKKAQEALADQFLTMVFDFAMKPVEDFFKNSLGGIFGIPNEEQQRQKSIDAMERQLAELKEHKTILAGIERNTAAGGGVPAPSGAPSVPAPGQSMAAGVSSTEATPMGNGVWQLPVVPEITQSSTAYSAGLEAVKTATSSAAVSVGESAKEISAEGPAGAQWQKALGQVVGGIGLAAGSIMGIAAGINQIKEGGTSNVLGGIGTIASMAGSLLGGFSSLGGLFSGGAPAPNMGGKNYFNPQTGKGVAGPNFGLANGGIMHGGFMPFRAFANGGIVTGPTMGLVGEGKYSEAVVPLPNGKSIPVQFSGERSARDMMSRSAQSTAQASPINLSFETTKIGNTEYVSRDQLEAAMAETRRSAISGGAARGMSMTLDRIQQSPSVRSRIGIR
jgi:tape measure domain-containing protein